MISVKTQLATYERVGKSMQLSKETIQYLSQLCRIKCTEKEQEALLADLSKILSYAEQLQEVNTQNVAPCNHVLDDIFNVTREDIVGEVMSQEAFFANVPARVGTLIRIPTVIKQQS